MRNGSHNLRHQHTPEYARLFPLSSIHPAKFYLAAYQTDIAISQIIKGPDIKQEISQICWISASLYVLRTHPSTQFSRCPQQIFGDGSWPAVPDNIFNTQLVKTSSRSMTSRGPPQRAQPNGRPTDASRLQGQCQAEFEWCILTQYSTYSKDVSFEPPARLNLTDGRRYMQKQKLVNMDNSALTAECWDTAQQIISARYQMEEQCQRVPMTVGGVSRDARLMAQINAVCWVEATKTLQLAHYGTSHEHRPRCPQQIFTKGLWPAVSDTVYAKLRAKDNADLPNENTRTGPFGTPTYDDEPTVFETACVAEFAACVVVESVSQRLDKGALTRLCWNRAQDGVARFRSWTACPSTMVVYGVAYST
ncbi:MAG: hypothetical protein M1829_000044 [Trizodia sp. TS-e1964]|nr:MAG: hypothetical protein M1829_000044 [Trizodia sp. TS-e1964]